MAISFSCTVKNLRPGQYQDAVTNLKALLKELPPAQQLLLAHTDVCFEFCNTEGVSGKVVPFSNRIELNIHEFSNFKHQPRALPNQRWALSTLKEETIHHLANLTHTDSSRAWKEAVANERKMPNKAREKFFKEQRKYDSSEDEIKLSHEEYSQDASSLRKIGFTLVGRSEIAEEWLVDVLLVRDYLKNIRKKDDRIDLLMNAAFPETYPLALRFEQALEQRALQNGPLDQQLKALHAQSLSV